MTTRTQEPIGSHNHAHYMPAAEEPRRSVSAAGARYWFLVLLLMLLGAGAGVLMALLREPIYTAEAQLNVGSINATIQAVPGYVEATKQLAASYSRSVTTSKVLDPAAEAVGVPSADIRDQIDATPVAGSPIISIKAEGASPREAQRLASAVADTLVREVRRDQRSGDPASKLLRDYRRAAAKSASAEDTLSRLRARDRLNPDSVSSKRIRSARADLEAARLDVSTLASLYTQAKSGNPRASGIEVLQHPSGASSDRDSTLQKLGFAGGVAGAVVGLALASLLDQRRRRGLHRGT